MDSMELFCDDVSQIVTTSHHMICLIFFLWSVLSLSSFPFSLSKQELWTFVHFMGLRSALGNLLRLGKNRKRSRICLWLLGYLLTSPELRLTSTAETPDTPLQPPPRSNPFHLFPGWIPIKPCPGSLHLTTHTVLNTVEESCHAWMSANT